MCTVEVPTCRPLCLAEVMRKVNRVRNLLNRLNDDNNNESIPTTENFQSARRVLFDDGPVDHELRAQILARETERIRRDVSARWNFDFDTETPLQGRYLWTPVFENLHQTGMLRVASVSQMPSESTSTMPPTSTEEPVPELVPVPSSSSETEKRVEPETRGRKMTRQRKLTDFMTQRKRSSTTSSKPSTASKSPESKVRRTSTTTTTTATTTA